MIQMNTLPTPASLTSRYLSAGLPVVAPEGNPSATYHAVKRLLDILGSLSLILILAPLLLPLLVVLSITTRGKPFFRQRRAGHLGKTFMMFKFRTMHLDADKPTALRFERDERAPFSRTARTRGSRGWPHAAGDEHRRAAAVVQRAARGDVAGGPAAARSRGARNTSPGSGVGWP